jgi:hypothetical protein
MAYPKAWRFAVIEHLPQCLPVQPGLAMHLPAADSINQHPTLYLAPLLHVREHPPV